jgi:hypothetical protein
VPVDRRSPTEGAAQTVGRSSGSLPSWLVNYVVVVVVVDGNMMLVSIVVVSQGVGIRDDDDVDDDAPRYEETWGISAKGVSEHGVEHEREEKAGSKNEERREQQREEEATTALPFPPPQTRVCPPSAP